MAAADPILAGKAAEEITAKISPLLPLSLSRAPVLPLPLARTLSNFAGRALPLLLYIGESTGMSCSTFILRKQ